ncbi:MAG TPA: nuclear transport factor 2 family protein [Nevskiales bacterium]|nr:nuclear transport factor 2 family protein [Nevskiales bacterium]
MSRFTPEAARRFAADWAAAWNAHDLDRILAHYAEDFEMRSPMIVQVTGEPTGCLRGKTAVRAYWAQALAALPKLRFEVLDVLCGMDSLTVYYQGHRGRVAEVFEFGADGRVLRAHAHYA